MKLSERMNDLLHAAKMPDWDELNEWHDEVAKLEAENEALWKHFHAGGDHDWSCSTTHGTGLICDCGFQEILDALLTEDKPTKTILVFEGEEHELTGEDE